MALARILAHLLEDGFVRREDVQKRLSVYEPTAKRYLLLLRKAGPVNLEGAGRDAMS